MLNIELAGSIELRNFIPPVLPVIIMIYSERISLALARA